jgi:hypothetical protein
MVGKTIKQGSCRTTRQGNPIQADYSTNNNNDKIEHSKLLTLVFEEAEELIRERWQVLNDLATSKSQPKVKYLRAKLKTKTSAVDRSCVHVIGGQAEKSRLSYHCWIKRVPYKSLK